MLFFFCRTSSAIRVYREAISTGLLPSSDVLSQVLGCFRFPHDSSLKNTFIENMGINCDIPHHPNINSLLEGFGEYDIRAFSILEVVMLSSIKPSLHFSILQILIKAACLLVTGSCFIRSSCKYFHKR